MRSAAAAVAFVAAAAWAWCGRPADAAIGGAAKVAKCCPMDAILRIDMAACTGYVAGDQNARESYAWTPPDDIDDGGGGPTAVAAESDENLALSLANGTSVPW